MPLSILLCFNHPITLILSYTRGRPDQPDYHSPNDLSEVPRLGMTIILNRNNKVSESEKALQELGKELQRPPLIMPEEAREGTSTDPTPLTAEHPTRQQPRRSQKEYVVYYVDDSQSSDEENLIDKTHSDSEYMPTKGKGTLSSCTFHRNIYLRHTCLKISKP